MSTGRLEAFSDGVIAIAITLLILDVRVPEAGHGSLGHALAHQWPSYAAYVVSFLTIGIIWINHTAMVGRLVAADHVVLMLNLVLLLSIGVLPFTTSLMAAYLRDDQGQHLAAVVYSGSFLLLGCLFFTMHRYVLSERRPLVAASVDRRARSVILRRNAMGLVPYAVAVLVAPLSAYASLAICGAVALYYAGPGVREA